MPSYSKLFLKPFIGGLNTEGSDTDDLTLYTSDELNCTILPEGKRGRRYGMNIEKDGKWIDIGEPIRTHSVYYWDNVYANNSYIVVQINTKLYIYEDITPISIREPIYTYEIPIQEASLINEPVSIVGVSNLLFVAGKWLLPFVLKYDADLGRFIDPEINNLKYRDFNGIDDGYKVDELPTTLTSRHLYNLKNQGWDKDIYDPVAKKTYSLLPSVDYNGKFFEDYKDTYGVGKYPANNMQWFVGKEKSGEYNTTDILNKYFGNTPAPKGHYILDYVSRSRQYVSNIDIDQEEHQATSKFNFENGFIDASYFNFAMAYMGVPDITVEQTLNNFSDYMTKQSDNVGISFSLPANITGILKKLKVTINDNTVVGNSLKEGVSVENYLYTNAKYRGRGSGTRKDFYIMAIPFQIQIQGIDSEGTRHTIYTADANFSKENSIGTPQTYNIIIPNPQTYLRYAVNLYWGNALSQTPNGLSLSPTKLTADVEIIELNETESGEGIVEGLPVSDLLTGAVSKVEAFGGRIFYLVGNTLLFSQTLKQGLQNYSKCYQDADPTSEEISDVVATDGGMIQLLSLGRGRAMKAFNRGIIVFGDKEVTGVLSPFNNLFTATEYDIVKIANIGVTGEYSPVSTDDSIYFWSNHGIYRIALVEDNIVCQCITNSTIHAYFMNIEMFSKNHVVGAYDGANNRIIWLYPTDENNLYKLDAGLVYDLNYQCFMPIQIDAGNVVRDLNNKYVGIYNNTTRTLNNEKVLTDGNKVLSEDGEVIGYRQNKFLTDTAISQNVVKIKPTIAVRAEGVRIKAGDYNVVVKTDTDVEYNRNSSLIYMAIDDTKFTFADFNDREFRDWDVSPYESYMVSRPITLGDTYYNKQTPIMQTLFQRTEEYKLNTDKNFVRIQEPIQLASRQHHVGTDYSIQMSPTQNEMAITGCHLVVDHVKDNYNDTSKNGIGFRIDISYIDEDGNKQTAYGSARTIDADGNIKFLDDIFPKKPCKNLKMTLMAIKVNKWYVKELEVSGYIEGYSYDTASTKVVAIDNTSLKGTIRGIKTDDKVLFRIPLLGNDKVYAGSVRFYPNTYNATSNLNSESWHAAMYSVNPNPIRLHSDNTYIDKWNNEFDHYGFLGLDGYFNLEVRNFNGPKPFDYMDCEYDLKAVAYRKEYVKPALNIADYTTASGNYIRMRWGWSLSDRSNRWDMKQNAYRRQKDFLYDDYVESRIHICGRGKAFQVEIRNDENKDFRLLGLNVITRSAQ